MKTWGILAKVVFSDSDMKYYICMQVVRKFTQDCEYHLSKIAFLHRAGVSLSFSGASSKKQLSDKGNNLFSSR